MTTDQDEVDPTAGLRARLDRLDRARSAAEADLALLALRKAANAFLDDTEPLARTPRKRKPRTETHEAIRKAFDISDDEWEAVFGKVEQPPLPMQSKEAIDHALRSERMAAEGRAQKPAHAALIAHAARRGTVIVSSPSGRFTGRLLNYNPSRPHDGASVEQGGAILRVPIDSVRIARKDTK